MLRFGRNHAVDSRYPQGFNGEYSACRGVTWRNMLPLRLRKGFLFTQTQSGGVLEMSKNREIKEQVVADIIEKFKNAQSVEEIASIKKTKTPSCSA